MKIAVIIPAYKVSRQICDVVARIGAEVSSIYVVDDACPEHSGEVALSGCSDPRLIVIKHEINQGVGGATLTGILRAIAEGAQICVKIDGDGQMDPALIEQFTTPLAKGYADYTKGNRFYYLDQLRIMPPARLIGNAALSFLSKLSTGYWDIFDPTNGYIAVRAEIVRHLPIEKIAKRYFFESDLMFHLALIRARVLDVPMHAVYGDEISNLRVGRSIPYFLWSHTRNLMKRVVYNYFLRDFSIASIFLLLSAPLTLFSIVFGLYQWRVSESTGETASSGTVMLAALPMILGLQFLLSFLQFDISQVPSQPIWSRLAWRRRP